MDAGSQEPSTNVCSVQTLIMGIVQMSLHPKCLNQALCVSAFRESTSMKSDQQRVTMMITDIKPDFSVSFIPTNTPLAMRNSKKKSFSRK